MSYQPEYSSTQTSSTLPEAIVKFNAARSRKAAPGFRFTMAPVPSRAPVPKGLFDDSLAEITDLAIKDIDVPESSIPEVAQKVEQNEQSPRTFRVNVAMSEHVKPGQARVLRNDQRGQFGIIEGFSDNEDPDKVEEDAAAAVAAFGQGVSHYWEQDTGDFTPENAIDLMKQALRSGHEALAQAADAGQGSPEMGIVGTFVRIFKNANGTHGAVIGHVGDGAALLRPETGQLAKYLTEREINEDDDFTNSFSPDPEDGMAELDQFTFIPELQDGARIALLSGVVVDGEDNGLVQPWKLQRVLANQDGQAATSELVTFGSPKEDQLAVLIDFKEVTAQATPASDSVTPDVAAGVAAGDSAAGAVSDPDVSAYNQHNRTRTPDHLAKKAARHLMHLPKHLSAKLSIAAMNALTRDTSNQPVDTAGKEKRKRKYIVAGAAGSLALAAAAYVQLKYGIVGGHHAAQSATKGAQRVTEINNQAQDAIQEAGKRTAQALQAQQAAEHAKDLAQQHGTDALHHGAQHAAHTNAAHDALQHAATTHNAILHHNHVIWNDTQHVIRAHYPQLSPQELQEHTKRAVDGILHANHINYTDARYLPDDFKYKVPRHIWHVMTNFKD